MLRITAIELKQPYHLVCTFNNGKRRNIDVEPILKKQAHIRGVTDLLDVKRFNEVEIGLAGEVCWRGVVQSGENRWDYDLSPEFVFAEGVPV